MTKIKFESNFQVIFVKSNGEIDYTAKSIVSINEKVVILTIIVKDFVK